MQYIGRRIYYDKLTGDVVLDMCERIGDVKETTIDDDFEKYRALQERVKDTVGVIQLEYGQYSQDFEICNGYKINLETNTLEFSYPTEGEQPQEPVYQKPLSEQVADLQKSIAELSMLLATPM